MPDGTMLAAARTLIDRQKRAPPGMGDRTRSRTKSNERQLEERSYREALLVQIDERRSKDKKKKQQSAQTYDYSFFDGLGQHRNLPKTNDGADYIEYMSTHKKHDGTKILNRNHQELPTKPSKAPRYNLDNYPQVHGHNLMEESEGMPLSHNYNHRQADHPYSNSPERKDGETTNHNKKKSVLINSSKIVIEGDHPPRRGQANSRKGRNDETNTDGDYFDRYFGEAGDNDNKRRERAKDEYYDELMRQIDNKAKKDQKSKVTQRMDDIRDEQRYLKDLRDLENANLAENERNLALVEKERAQKEEFLRYEQEADVMQRRGLGKGIPETQPGTESDRSSAQNLRMEKGTDNVMSDRDLQNLNKSNLSPHPEQLRPQYDNSFDGEKVYIDNNQYYLPIITKISY